MRVAILITAHNRKEKTLSCLEQVGRQIIPPRCNFQVYLVEDGCTDGTTEAVSVIFPEVAIIHGDGSLFWNRGMWTAWNQAAKEDFDGYIWLNDDTVVYLNMLKVLLKTSNKFNNQSIIVGPTQDSSHSKLTYGGRYKKGKIANTIGKITKVDFFNGNIVYIPRNVYQKVGNLDYYYTHSKGDFDYGLRARKLGINIYQTAEILGECDLHEDLDSWCNPQVPFRKRWLMLHRPNGMPPKETFYFERKHFNILLATFHYFTIYLRCIIPQLWRVKTFYET